MDRKKYMIISDAGSMHIYNFIKHSLLGRNFDIYIVSHAVKELPERNKKLYEEHNIKVISVIDFPYKDKTDKISKFKKLNHKLNQIKKIGKIDVCHIHFLHIQSCIIYLLCKNIFNKLILTYWGSDILKLNKKTKIFQKLCIKRADKITLSVANTFNVFRSHYGDKFDSKASIVRFVSGALIEINDLMNNNNRIQIKSELGFPKDKYAVTIGYNADPDQFQDEYIRNISSMPQDIKDRMFLVLPLQYGRVNMQYIDSIHNELVNSGCEYIEIHNYMDYKQMSRLCVASDIYVHARKTDAFSSSLKEQLYSGTHIIQGSWLKYIELDEINWERTSIHQKDQLSTALVSVIKRFDENSGVIKNSCELMWNLTSPKNVRSQWDAVFKELEIE